MSVELLTTALSILGNEIGGGVIGLFNIT